MSGPISLFLNGRYLSQTPTGVQRHAAELVRAIDQRLIRGEAAEFAVTLLVPPNARRENHLSAIRVSLVGRLSGQAWEQVHLARYARGGVLMSFGNTAPLLHPRQAVTLHDAGVFAIPDSYSLPFRLWYRLLFPLIGRRAAVIVTDSVFSRDELVHYAGLRPDRIQVVHCGCEHILASPPDAAILRSSGLEPRRFVLACGGYTPRKNLGLVLQALTLLGPEAPALAVVGVPNSRVLGRSEIPERAVLLGHVSDAELRALYENALCLVFPSLYEGFGIPPLEAMACGCPAVVARTSSLPEVCGEAARYVDPQDAAGLAAELQGLLDDPARLDALRVAGRARAQEFTWDRAAAMTLDLARRLAASNRGGRA